MFKLCNKQNKKMLLVSFQNSLKTESARREQVAALLGKLMAKLTQNRQLEKINQ